MGRLVTLTSVPSISFWSVHSSRLMDEYGHGHHAWKNDTQKEHIAGLTKKNGIERLQYKPDSAEDVLMQLERNVGTGRFPRNICVLQEVLAWAPVILVLLIPTEGNKVGFLNKFSLTPNVHTDAWNCIIFRWFRTTVNPTEISVIFSYTLASKFLRNILWFLRSSWFIFKVIWVFREWWQGLLLGGAKVANSQSGINLHVAKHECVERALHYSKLSSEMNGRWTSLYWCADGMIE